MLQFPIGSMYASGFGVFAFGLLHAMANPAIRAAWYYPFWFCMLWFIGTLVYWFYLKHAGADQLRYEAKYKQTLNAVATVEQPIAADLGRFTEELSPLLPKRPDVQLPAFQPFRIGGPHYRFHGDLMALDEAVASYAIGRELAPRTLEAVARTVEREVPKPPQNAIAEVPLFDALDVRRIVPIVIGRFFTSEVEKAHKNILTPGPFEKLRHQLNSNRFGYSKKHNKDRIDPEDFKGSNKELVDTYLADTPLLDMFYQTVPFGFDDDQRFKHQFVVGPTGTGKTTYLSTLIHADLDRVARGECAIVVMDSQNVLIPNIAKLKRFAPGGDLEGKLIYISPDYVPAINLFDVHGADARTAFMLVNFFIRSGLAGETSSNMDTVLRYLVPATLAIPNATVFTLRDLLTKGYEAYKNDLIKLPPRIRDWLQERLSPKKEGSLKVTFDAIRTKLDGFGPDELFGPMFEAPRSKLDFSVELDTPKVILINTNKAILREQCEPFGRLFMAQIFLAAQNRMLTNRRLPTFVYIDEAGDYIAEEPMVEDIIDEVRKQNVGVTLATQGESKIRSPAVLAALRRVGLTVRLPVAGDALISVERTPERLLKVPETNFAKQPQMTPREWQSILAEMKDRYGVSAEAPHMPAPTPKPTLRVVANNPPEPPSH